MTLALGWMPSTMLPLILTSLKSENIKVAVLKRIIKKQDLQDFRNLGDLLFISSNSLWR